MKIRKKIKILWFLSTLKKLLDCFYILNFLLIPKF